MPNIFQDWIQRVFGRSPAKRWQRQTFEPVAPEVLEERRVLTATLPDLAATSLIGGKDQYIALPGTDSNGQPVTYSVTSSNSSISASIVTAGTNIRMTVSGVDANNQPFSGVLTFRLFDSVAPATVARITELINSGFYNGLTFHRIVDNFVIQGGDPAGNGTGGTGTKFSDEFDKNLTFTSQGLLAMANSGDDTNDSQFFVTDIDLSLAQMPQNLNFNHTIFGILTSGFDIYQKIITTPVSGQTPINAPVMSNVEVFTDDQHGLLKLSAADGVTGTANIQVTATSAGNSTVTKSFFATAVADTQNDRPFLGPVNNIATQPGTPITFTVTGTDLERDNLTFAVTDPSSYTTDNSVGTAIQNATVSISTTQATATTPAIATITITPNQGFTGTINLLVSVRDNTNRGGSSLDSRINLDSQKITLTVDSNAPVNGAPTANAGGPYTVTEGGSLTVNASASTDPDNDTLTYSWDINGDGIFGDATGVNPTLTRTQLSTLGINNGPSSFNIRVRVDDGHGHVVISDPAVFTYTNAPPVVSVSGPATGDKATELTFTLTATDQSTSDQNAGFKFEIDWDGDGTVDQTVNGTSPQTVTHTFATAGQNTVKVTATDVDGGKSTVFEKQVLIKGVDLVNGTLNVVGDDEDNTIKIVHDRANDLILLYMDGEFVDSYDVTDMIKVFGQGGNDRIYLWPDVRFNTILDGGAGDDIIRGGKGNDLIRGGDGNDTITGRRGDDMIFGGAGFNNISGDSGNDVIVGGASSDLIRGGSGKDVIIGGDGADRITTGFDGSLVIDSSTDFDDDEDALTLIRNAWIGEGTFEERVQLLSETGVGDDEIKLINDADEDEVTITDDGEADRIFGNGRGWYLGFTTDRISDSTHNALKEIGDADNDDDEDDDDEG